MSGYEIGFAPLIPWPSVPGALAVVLILLTVAARARLSGAGLRACAAAILLLALANPSLIEEQRHSRPDIALVVVDESPSQDVGSRQKRTQTALTALHNQASQIPDLELRVVRAGREADDLTGNAQTRLFTALERARTDIPSRRYAGAVLITDGQIHDLPAHLRDGPVHALLTGQRGESDRRLTVVQAPAYGLVDRPATLTLRIDDEGEQPHPIPVTLRMDGEAAEQVAILPNQDSDIAIPLRHGGQNVLEISAPVRNGELTGINNRTAVVINGIRDRLRVLLISGEPYPGERTWRSLLKADPSVDLVHFTILRPPGKQDGTSIEELSLIAFPTRELFEVKLKEFDLIVFDRYRQQNIISQSYLQAIADYVEAGGAVLEASGASYASSLSLYRSPLGAVLPGAPSGRVLEQPFRPVVSPLGQRHPVTAGLPGANPADAARPPSWGEWLRQIDIAPTGGQTIMTGIDGKPLLVLDRVGRGRIAQLASDHVWLWARGYQGGGPQGELLRRIAHWLMKEPALEEEDLVVLAQEGKLSIERRSLSPVEGTVSVTDPHGKRARLPLIEGKASIAATAPGLYRIQDDSRSRAIAVGAINPKEYSDLRSRDDQLKPLLAESGGGVVWLADLPGPAPDIRRTAKGRSHYGRDWIGLARNRDYDVTGYRRTPLLPGWALLCLTLGLIGLSWQREGR